MPTFLTRWFRRWSSPGAGKTSSPRLNPESAFVLEVTATGITIHRPGGGTESVLFADLEAVIIETNDTGPLGNDVWWILAGRDLKSGCVFPMGSSGEGDALARLQKLPGFDNRAVIRAMGSCTCQKFLCWHRDWDMAAHQEPAFPGAME